MPILFRKRQGKDILVGAAASTSPSTPRLQYGFYPSSEAVKSSEYALGIMEKGPGLKILSIIVDNTYGTNLKSEYIGEASVRFNGMNDNLYSQILT